MLITFLLSGLWHGASWNYVLWGLYHGLLLVITRAARRLAPSGRRPPAWLAVPQIAGTFILILIGWLMFRETDLAALGRDLALSPFGAGAADRSAALYLFLLTLVYASPLWIHSVWVDCHRGADGARRPSPVLTAARPQLVLQGLACGLAFAAILVLRSPTSLGFIYFQF